MCLTVAALELDVIIIANRSDTPVHTLAFDILDACIEGLAAPSADAGVREGLPIGLYYCRETASPLVVAQEGEELTVKLHDTKIPVRAEADGRLICTLPGLDLTLAPVEGEVIQVDLQGSTNLFRRIETGKDDPLAEAARLAGDYRCDEVEAGAAAKVEDGAVSLVMSGPYGRDVFSLTRLSPGIWTSSLGETGFGGVLEFAMDNDGHSGFTLSTPRTSRLPFTRVA
jgi:hypothetical protein